MAMAQVATAARTATIILNADYIDMLTDKLIHKATTTSYNATVMAMSLSIYYRTYVSMSLSRDIDSYIAVDEFSPIPLHVPCTIS